MTNNSDVNLKNLSEKEWRQFKMYFDFLIKSGSSDEDAKQDAYKKVISNRKVAKDASKYFRY